MENSIQGLMDTAMKNIRAMVDVNTIIGDPVNVPDGTIIIPVSTVSFGFGAGGSDFAGHTGENHFGGGSGGGAKVKPVAFLVVGNGNIRILPISTDMSPVDRVIDLMPEMIDKVNGAVKDFADKMDSKKKAKASDDTIPEVDPFGA
jgi:sporulation protein YtfJ